MKETTVSEEQVLFNKLSYEEQQFILKQMRMLQPCEISCEVEEEKKIPEKIKLYTLSDNDSADFTTLQDFNNRDIQRIINWILDYLKSKGE